MLLLLLLVLLLLLLLLLVFELFEMNGNGFFCGWTVFILGSVDGTLTERVIVFRELSGWEVDVLVLLLLLLLLILVLVVLLLFVVCCWQSNSRCLLIKAMSLLTWIRCLACFFTISTTLG